MQKLILTFCLLFINFIYSQNHFTYTTYIKNTKREGILITNNDKNTAVYIDKIKASQIIDKKAEEKIATVNIMGNNDAIYYKENFNNLKYTRNLLKMNYLVDDSTLKINWQLLPETKNINGYLCYKAEANFRGRFWTVWYSPQIPTNYGPWKFYGLPGLIFEAKDKTNEFAFILNEITQTNNIEYPVIDLNKFKKVNLQSYSALADDALTLKSLSNSRDYMIESKTEYKRNGIEIIYEWEEQNKNN